MAASEKGVERRPMGVNLDEETRVKVGEVADGVDEQTRDLIVHDTTTRERTAVHKRAHEPLDADVADDDQPDESGNGPRAKELGPQGPVARKPKADVSEGQLKAGREARTAGVPATGDDSK
jgi:hypothetical protein